MLPPSLRYFSIWFSLFQYGKGVWKLRFEAGDSGRLLKNAWEKMKRISTNQRAGNPNHHSHYFSTTDSVMNSFQKNSEILSEKNNHSTRQKRPPIYSRLFIFSIDPAFSKTNIFSNSTKLSRETTKNRYNNAVLLT